jgi:hypothetical protein
MYYTGNLAAAVEVYPTVRHRAYFNVGRTQVNIDSRTLRRLFTYLRCLALPNFTEFRKASIRWWVWS